MLLNQIFIRRIFIVFTALPFIVSGAFAQSDAEIKDLNVAIGHYQNGDKDQAIAVLTDVIKTYPKSYYGYLYRGSCYGELEKYDLAIADSKKLVEYYPDDPSGYINVTAYLMHANRFGESKEYVMKSFELGKFTMWQVWINRACYHWWEKDILKAKEYMLKTVEMIPSVADYNALIESLDKMIAKGLLSDTYQLMSFLKNEWTKAGDIYIQIQKYDQQAIEHLDKKEDIAAAQINKKASDLALTIIPPNYQMAMQFAGYEASIYKRLDKKDEAKATYNRILEYIEKGHLADSVAGENANSGGLFFKNNHDNKRAAVFYAKANDIFQKMEYKAWLTIIASNLGEVYNNMGDYEQSLKYYNQSIKLGKETGEESGLSITYNNISSTYENLGQYETAIEMAKQAVALGEKYKHASLSAFYSSLGHRYYAIGDYASALPNYEKALALDRKNNDKFKISQRLGSIGSTYLGLRKLTLAEQELKESVKIAEEVGSVMDMAAGWHNLGMVYKDLKKTNEARTYFEKSLTLYKKYGLAREAAGDLMILGQLNYERFDNTYKAEQYLKEAETIYSKLKLSLELSEVYYHLAGMYAKKNNITEAIKYGEKGVGFFESIRTSGNKTSVIQLSTSIKLYEVLAATYAANKQYKEAFNTFEKVKANVLVSKLSVGTNPVAATTSLISSKLPSNTAMISYMNTGHGIPTFITITNSNTYGYFPRMDDSSTSSFDQNFKSLLSKYEAVALTTQNNQRGFKPSKKQDVVVAQDQAMFNYEKFENLINYYRTLLINQGNGNADGAVIKEIAQGLYQYLIAPIESNVVGKKELVIIPEGILSYLPFETLIDQNGKYLIEKYTIQYTQSATVWSLIQGRNYPASRKPMLAFGGAIYQGTGATTGTVNSEDELNQLQSELKNNNKTFTRGAYQKLGIGSWGDLPGTLKEVNTIKASIPGSVVLTGSSASEAKISDMSLSGQLDDYKVIHFATHGVVVPEIPELSALVLSQSGNTKEDGYLTMQEIEGLKIKADFVNLSACETGLGKIYGGEGVVGLTQSFLVAGANGLSVSLWQVADESTMKFMTGLYKEVNAGKNYKEASAEMKRQFINGIHGEQYKNPYYWSPFVYYGK
ncbi:CHAT domain-containing protein [Reichenbachiella sp. MALMAid0571]|uniref:CHAT domain-containing protein n=1 Tax=Reichenbachiella sp. MALMAid0571 TaxID=3143939 RepID=UPI0032DFAB2C